MKEFQLSKFTNQGAKLLESIQQEFIKLKLDDSALPKIFSDDDNAIKLVFVGQYSAGKSSIIKMLTNSEVEIGAAITTQSASTYKWNGLEIIDTPGIHTELRFDHDEITYDQINHAALLIFVITNEGFTQRMGSHFRELAINQQRAANMVLVVNKMDRTALGNVPEQQEIIARDLEKVTQPYKPQDLYLSFLDTSSYFDSLEEQDSEIKEELFDLSGHDNFVANLNKFVAGHKVFAKVTKPLYTMAEAIRSAIKTNASTDDNDVKEFINTIEHRKELLLDGKRKCLRDVRDIATQCRDEISKQGREAANIIQPENEQEKVTAAIKDAQREVQNIANNYSNKISDCLNESFKNVGAEIETYNESEFVKQVNIKINDRIKFTHNAVGNQAAARALAGLGALIAKFHDPAAMAVGNPGAFAILAGKGVGIGADLLLKGELGIFAKAIALPLEKFIVKILTPPPTMWEQIGAFFARNAGNIGKGLGGAGAVLAIGLEVKAANDAQKLEQALQAERVKLIKNFDEVAEEIYDKFNDAVTEWIANNIDNIIQECNDTIKSLRGAKRQTESADKTLNELLNQTENLIAEIQNSH